MSKMIDYDVDYEEDVPANVFLVCPTDLGNAKFNELLVYLGWRSVLFLATSDVKSISFIKHAQTIYIVLSSGPLSLSFADMVLKALEITEGSDCKRLLLRLDYAEIPPLLSKLNQLEEDTSLFSYLAKLKALKSEYK